jgi:hypothetical protein
MLTKTFWNAERSRAEIGPPLRLAGRVCVLPCSYRVSLGRGLAVTVSTAARIVRLTNVAWF